MNTDNLYPRFSDAEFSRRYALVRAAMQEADLSALVLYGTAGLHSEVQYQGVTVLHNHASRQQPFLALHC